MQYIEISQNRTLLPDSSPEMKNRCLVCSVPTKCSINHHTDRNYVPKKQQNKCFLAMLLLTFVPLQSSPASSSHHGLEMSWESFIHFIFATNSNSNNVRCPSFNSSSLSLTILVVVGGQSKKKLFVTFREKKSNFYHPSLQFAVKQPLCHP